MTSGCWHSPELMHAIIVGSIHERTCSAHISRVCVHYLLFLIIWAKSSRAVSELIWQSKPTDRLGFLRIAEGDTEEVEISGHSQLPTVLLGERMELFARKPSSWAQGEFRELTARQAIGLYLQCSFQCTRVLRCCYRAPSLCTSLAMIKQTRPMQ